jgi:hypothetical protein
MDIILFLQVYNIKSMSCYNAINYNNTNYYYLPQPPRAWSRVQNSCSLVTDADANNSALFNEKQMLEKGNILQYKKNSSNLTKVQRYSKIAKGQWVNRNTTWATQSMNGYTNPNTQSLKRGGNVINIAIDPITGLIIGPTTEPVTCQQQIIPINPMLPPNIDATGVEPLIPPPIEPTEGSDVTPAIIPEEQITPIIIQDGGSLVCSIQENECTGETKYSVSQTLCHPTTDSNVPGAIQELCWNDGMPTWYPRQRYVMTNSSNKWPINYKLFVSALKPIPNLSS